MFGTMITWLADKCKWLLNNVELWITFVDKCREKVITFCDSGVVVIGGWGTESCNFSKKSCNFSMGKKGAVGKRKGYRGKWKGV